MTARVFIDTTFVQALLNAADQYHSQAVTLRRQIHSGVEMWTTQAVLMEVGNSLSAMNRPGFISFLSNAFRDPKVKIVPIDSHLFRRGVDLYRNRRDKQWGMTDCCSFIVMQDQQISDALTADRHFVQAGFNILFK